MKKNYIEIKEQYYKALGEKKSLKIDLRNCLEQQNSPIVHRIILEDSLKEELYRNINEIKLDPYKEFDNIKAILEKNNLHKKFFSSLSSQKNKVPIIFIQNLPIDCNLISTPLDDGYCINKEKITEKVLLTLTTALGISPYVNMDEKGNSVIQNIVPIKGKEFELSGASTSVTFNWHTENVHEASPADYFILSTLRGDKNAFTSVMLVQDIVNIIPRLMLKELLRTSFIMRTGPTYEKEINFIRPILSVDKKGNYDMYYNSDINRCFPINSFGENLYMSLQQYIKEKVPSYAVSLRPGEAMILNNKRVLHKRDAFEVSTSTEERRWLQVVYLKKI
ncbi:MAG: TauD/TfdA family dioxygenase [Rickettsiales bacterium]